MLLHEDLGGGNDRVYCLLTELQVHCYKPSMPLPVETFGSCCHQRYETHFSSMVGPDPSTRLDDNIFLTGSTLAQLSEMMPHSKTKKKDRFESQSLWSALRTFLRVPAMFV